MQALPYTLRDDRRARRIVITVRRDGSVVATKPRWVTRAIADRFVRENRSWIDRTRAKYGPRPNTSRIESSAHEYVRLKKIVQREIAKRVKHFAPLYGAKHARVIVRNQKSRWGSCAKSGTISFNYRLLFLPAELADYVVVHEVCHLLEMNHSKRFWALVARTIPNHVSLRKELRKLERQLLV
jgi:predicted metal-dependent hydrolase